MSIIVEARRLIILEEAHMKNFHKNMYVRFVLVLGAVAAISAMIGFGPSGARKG